MKPELVGRCPACLERHPPESECPPFEARTTGMATYLAYIADLEEAVEQLRAEVAELEQLRMAYARKVVKLNIARRTNVPWSDVPEEEVDAYVAEVERLYITAEAAGEKGKLAGAQEKEVDG